MCTQSKWLNSQKSKNKNQIQRKYHLTIYFENMSTGCYDNSLNVTYVDLFTVRNGSIETCNDVVL